MHRNVWRGIPEDLNGKDTACQSATTCIGIVSATLLERVFKKWVQFKCSRAELAKRCHCIEIMEQCHED